MELWDGNWNGTMGMAMEISSLDLRSPGYGTDYTLWNYRKRSQSFTCLLIIAFYRSRWNMSASTYYNDWVYYSKLPI